MVVPLGILAVCRPLGEPDSKGGEPANLVALILSPPDLLSWAAQAGENQTEGMAAQAGLFRGIFGSPPVR